MQTFQPLTICFLALIDSIKIFSVRSTVVTVFQNRTIFFFYQQVTIGSSSWKERDLPADPGESIMIRLLRATDMYFPSFQWISPYRASQRAQKNPQILTPHDPVENRQWPRVFSWISHVPTILSLTAPYTRPNVYKLDRWPQRMKRDFKSRARYWYVESRAFPARMRLAGATLLLRTARVHMAMAETKHYLINWIPEMQVRRRFKLPPNSSSDQSDGSAAKSGGIYVK